LQVTPSDEIDRRLAEFVGLWRACAINNKIALENFLTSSPSADLDELEPISRTSALHVAAKQNYLGVCKILLSKGANVNVTSGDGSTPLMFACQHPDGFELVQLLLRDYSANIHLTDGAGNTALAYAVRGGSLRIVDALVTAGIDVNVVNNQKVSPMMHAALTNNISLIEALSGAGADINAQDSDGNTALHYVCLTGNLKAAKLLVQCGAQIETPNNRGRTAIDVACSTEIVDAVSER
jgi:ankyrin repeat protein